MNIETLPEELSGTGYSLELSDETRKKFARFVDRGREIEERYSLLKPRLESVIRNDPEFRAFQTFQTNQLELQGPTLTQTQEIIAELTKMGDPEDLWQFSNKEVLNKFLAMRIVQADSHIIDVLGQHQANLLVERIAEDLRSDRPFVEADLRALNKFCIQGKLNAGEYRTHDRVNIGQFFADDDPLWFSRDFDRPVEVKATDIPEQAREICEYISRKHSLPALSAAVAHAWFTHLHPFEDGNGRVGRLIANLVLLKNGWPPITIRKSRRDEYLDALSFSDEAGDISLLFELFVEEIDETLSELEDDRYWKKRYALALRTDPEQRQVDWIQRARDFVELLRQNLRPFGFVVERVSMPDIPTFTLLEQREQRATALFAKIKNPSDRREIRVGLGFASSQFVQIDTADTTVDGVHIPPTLYFQERDFRSTASFPYVHRRDSALPTREFSFFPGREREVIALFGLTQPTPISLTISEFAERLTREIDQLKFPLDT